MSRGRERYSASEFEAAVETVLAGASYKAAQGVTGVRAISSFVVAPAWAGEGARRVPQVVKCDEITAAHGVPYLRP